MHLWFADKKNYKEVVKKIKLIESYIDANKIKREPIVFRIKDTHTFFAKRDIEIYFPFDKSIKLIYEKFRSNLEKNGLFSKNCRIKIQIGNLKKSFFNSNVIGNLMKKQIEDRIPFRKVLQDSLRIVKKEKIKGIKLQISGRLNGNEIARTEWIKYGQIPLHSIKTNIDYFSCRTFLIYYITRNK